MTWIKNEYPKGENEVVHSLVIGGLLPELKKYFENAKELYTPNKTNEPVDETLRNFVDQTGIVED
jgi:hypothetical protein